MNDNKKEMLRRDDKNSIAYVKHFSLHTVIPKYQSTQGGNPSDWCQY
jgi:hypothetical protein